jgi:hypothetical protein
VVLVLLLEETHRADLCSSDLSLVAMGLDISLEIAYGSFLPLENICVNEDFCLESK